MDSKLQQLLEKVATLHARKPASTFLTADVCISVIRKKFAADFEGFNFDDAKPAVTAHIETLEANAKAAAAKAAAAASNSKKAAESESDDSSDDSDDSSDEDGSGSDEESDEEDDDELEDDDSDDEEDDEEGEENEEAKAMKEQLAAAAKRTAAEAGATDVGDAADDDDAAVAKKPRQESPATRLMGMAKCLAKLKIKVRPIEASEDAQTYITQVLIPAFEANKLDPERYSKDDIAAYKMRKEMEFLTKDMKDHGVDMSLDRSTRRGRGIPAARPAAPKPSFMDDE